MISIVVPVYNVEEHLDQCVSSLIHQTYDDIEIVLVNDGSTDSSGVLCEQWAERDERIVVVAKANGGLSDARNRGIDVARGDYLGFVDSDDFVDERMYATLMNDLIKTNADLATCDVRDYYDGDQDFAVQERISEPWVVDSQTALKGMARSELPRIWVPTRLYSRSVFDSGFRFPVGKAYEDAYTIADLLSRVDSVSVNKSRLYNYCHHDQTITTSGYSAKTHDMIEAWDHSREVAAVSFPDLGDDFACRCLWARCSVLDKLILDGSMDNSQEERELVAYIRDHYPEVSDHPLLTRQRRTMCDVLRVSLPLYRVLVRLWRSKRQSYI